MSEQWDTVSVDQVQVGDLIRHREQEFVVARIDPKFLGRDNMICFIEDTPERWRALPAMVDGTVERSPAG